MNHQVVTSVSTQTILERTIKAHAQGQSDVSALDAELLLDVDDSSPWYGLVVSVLGQSAIRNAQLDEQLKERFYKAWTVEGLESVRESEASLLLRHGVDDAQLKQRLLEAVSSTERVDVLCNLLTILTGFIEEEDAIGVFVDLLGHTSPDVVRVCISALSRLEHVKVDVTATLLDKFDELDEWTQYDAACILTKAPVPHNKEIILDAVNSLDAYLQHPNGAVVLIVAQVVFRYAEHLPEIKQDIYARTKQLLLSASRLAFPEISNQLLQVILHQHEQHPWLTLEDAEYFYLRSQDAEYLKKSKLQGLTYLAAQDTKIVQHILHTLQCHYSRACLAALRTIATSSTVGVEAITRACLAMLDDIALSQRQIAHVLDTLRDIAQHNTSVVRVIFASIYHNQRLLESSTTKLQRAYWSCLNRLVQHQPRTTAVEYFEHAVLHVYSTESTLSNDLSLTKLEMLDALWQCYQPDKHTFHQLLGQVIEHVIENAVNECILLVEHARRCIRMIKYSR